MSHPSTNLDGTPSSTGEGDGASDPDPAPTQAPGLTAAAPSFGQPPGDRGGPSASRTAGEAGTLGGAPPTEAGPVPPGPATTPAGRLPRFLGEYELLEEIARGGMGVVYRARQDKLNRQVAVKLIRSGSLAGTGELLRFRREAEAIAELEHPHIIPIYEIGQEDDQPYFSMKLIPGGNLGRHIERLKDDPRTVVTVIAKVARAVHYAHQRTILHRDIKPSNILLAEHDEPYVTDFGLAKRIGPGSDTMETVTGAVMGTPAYMPPEQARGGTKSVTTAADVYSLGATLYEALTGQPPFAGESAGEIMRQVLDQEPARPRSIHPGLDRDLETICLKCLEKRPERRYGSAKALAEDLESWLGGMPIKARRVPAWEKAVKWVKRKPAIAALVLTLPLALLLLIGGGIWFTLRLQGALDLANRGRYAADMNLARRAMDDGLIYQVRKQLKIYESGPRALAKLRSFEWHYLANLCDPGLIRLPGHGQSVICVAFHPDGDRVVSGSSDGAVVVRDLAGRRAPQILDSKGQPIFCVAFSRDGRWLAAGDTRGLLRLWELGTGHYRDLAGHESAVRSVVFSTDNRHLLSADTGGLIVQWDVGAGRRDFPLLHRREGDYSSESFSGTNAAELGAGTIAAYGPDGRTIISAGANEWVMVWDAVTRRQLDRVRINTNVNSSSISPDGRQLALGTESPAVNLLDLERLHERPRVIVADGRRATIAFSPDGTTLAIHSIGGVVQLFDFPRDQLLNVFDDQVNKGPYTVAFGAGGGRLAMAVGAETHVVRVARSLEGTTVAAGLGTIRRLAVSPDERLFAVGRDDGSIAVWDIRAGRSIRLSSGHQLAVFGLAFLPGPGGPRLVSVGGDGSIRTWDPEAEGPPLRILGDGSRAVYAVAARRDGRQIATGGEDRAVHTWDPASGRPDLPPIDHGGPVSALAYDPTGAALAAGGTDGTVRIWSASSGGRRLGPLAHPFSIACLAFSPDGRLLAAGGTSKDRSAVWIRDASSGKVVARIDCQRGVNSLSFSPDSQRIATCGIDTVVQIWDATGGVETLSLRGHSDRVSAVLFAPKAMRLYSAGRNGAIKLWDGGTGPVE